MELMVEMVLFVCLFVYPLVCRYFLPLEPMESLHNTHVTFCVRLRPTFWMRYQQKTDAVDLNVRARLA